LDVVGVLTEQTQYVLGLGAGGDALGGEVGFVGVDREDGGYFGDGGVVSGAQGVGGVVERGR
jgi:hypothetical protein